MAINFPNSPSVNDTYTVGGVVYTWNGSAWVVTNALSIQGIQGASGIQGIQGSGSNITASNVGTVGVGVFKQKTGDNLEFKKLEAGNAVTLTDNVDSVSVSVPNVPDVDPYWQYVKILHHFNGPDGGTQMLDATQRLWTVAGNAQLDTADKKFGSASLLLDGTGDYIYTAHDSALSTNSGSGDFTMEAWIKLAALNRTHTISNKRDTSGAEEHSFQVISDNRLSGTLWNATPAGQVLSAAALTTGVWYHVAFCRTGNTLYLFLDGVLQSTITQTTSTANTGVFHIGRDGFDTARDFQGWIDEYRFTKGYNRYTSNFTPPTAPFPQGTSIGYFEGLSDVVIQSNVVAGSLLYKQADWTNTANTSGGLTWDPVLNALSITSTGDSGLIIRADTDDVTETDNPYITFLQDGNTVAAEIGFSGNAQGRPNGSGLLGGSSANYAQNDFIIAASQEIQICCNGVGNANLSDAVPVFRYMTGLNSSLNPLKVSANVNDTSNYTYMDYTTGTLQVRSTGDAIIKLEADSDNLGETDNAYILFTQDGGLVGAMIGTTPNTAGILPDGSAATNVPVNGFVIMNHIVGGSGGVTIGAQNNGMMWFDGYNQDIFTYVPFVTKAPTVTEANFRLPHGTAPTAPVNGDMWTTTDGLFVRIDSVTGQMLLSSRTISTTAPLAGGGDLSANRTLSININGISDSLLRQSAARSVVGRSAGTTGNVADITASSGSDGVLRESGGTLSFGTVATAGIANNAVTLGKLAQISTNRILGRVSASTGDVESLTGTQATTILDTFTTSLKGLVPASGGGTDNYLRADGTWAVPPGGTGSASDSFKTMTVTDTDSGYTWSETGSAVAASATSTLTLVSGADIDIDVDATSKAIRISSTAAAGSGYPPQLGYMGGF